MNPGGRKSFVLMVRVRGLGIQRRITIGTYPPMTLAVARKEARKHIENAQAGIDPREAIEDEKRARAKAKQDNERRSRRTFGKIAEDFIEDYARVNAPRYWREMESMLKPGDHLYRAYEKQMKDHMDFHRENLTKMMKLFMR